MDPARLAADIPHYPLGSVFLDRGLLSRLRSLQSLPKPLRLSKKRCDPEDSSGFEGIAHAVHKMVRTGETSCNYKREVQPLPKLGP